LHLSISYIFLKQLCSISCTLGLNDAVTTLPQRNHDDDV
jgi:hypothetical protein